MRTSMHRNGFSKSCRSPDDAARGKANQALILARPSATNSVAPGSTVLCRSELIVARSVSMQGLPYPWPLE